MFIADAHCDTLFRLGVAGAALSDCQVNPANLQAGGVTLQTCALWSGPKGPGGDYAAIADAEYAAADVLKQAGLTQVDDPAEAVGGKSQFMLSLEGCEVLQDDPASVAHWRQRGVRMGALVWNHVNALATPAKVNADDGLTAQGVRIAKEMQRLGMAVDVSHLNERGFYDLFLKGDRPPMASHSCCMSLCGHFRNLTDDQIRMMIQYGGYIGVNFYPRFLDEDCRADAALIARHIDHICQMGGIDAVGLGSDFDGIELSPDDLRHPGEMGRLFDALDRMGYDEDAMEKIAGRNFLAYFDRIR